MDTLHRQAKVSEAQRRRWAVGNEASRLVEWQDFINLAILTAIALAIGAYLIATTVLINKDAVVYIEQTKNFSSNPSLFARGAYPPGYPFLIYAAHRIVTLISNSASVESWIYSAQSVSLLCRVLSLIPLYFIGKLLVGSRNSYLALLILIVLPYPAEYGSEIVREWPHLLFLAIAFFFLTRAIANGNWRMFAAAGLFAGIGHTIRPECAQIVIYGILWMLVRLFAPSPNTSRLKAVFVTLILFAGFAVPAGFYMKARGRIIPEKLERVISAAPAWKSSGAKSIAFDGAAVQSAGVPVDALKALGVLGANISDDLMHFFTVPLAIGLYRHFRKLRRILLTERFFIFALIVLYTVMMVLLYSYYGYISRRHCMPMVVFTVFYIPAGLRIIARRLCRMNSKSAPTAHIQRQRWFLILLALGVGICAVKFVRITPLRWEKRAYRDVAGWLRKNTGPEDIVVVPDNRISFYAERKGYLCEEDVDTGVTASDVMKTAIKQAETTKNKNNFSVSVFIVKTVKDDTKTMLAGTVEYPSSRKDFPLAEISRYSSLKNLVGYWPDGTIEDLSIYNNTTILCGDLSCVESKYGQCYSLTDNSDGYVNCGNSPVLNPTNVVSLSVMVYPTSASRGSIVTKNGPYAMEHLGDGKIRTGIYAGSPPTWTHAVTTSSLALNTWHHIVMTYDGTHMKTYINNKMDGAATAKSGKMTLTKSPVFIGYGLPGFDRYFKGMIDEVMIFQKALSEDEVSALNEMVESRTVPTFGTNVNAYPIFDCWKIERKYSLRVDERMKKKQLCIYKIE